MHFFHPWCPYLWFLNPLLQPNRQLISTFEPLGQLVKFGIVLLPDQDLLQSTRTGTEPAVDAASCSHWSLYQARLARLLTDTLQIS